MRGSVFHLIGFMAALLLVGVVSFSLILYKEFSIERKGIIQSSLIEDTNEMELLKKNLQQALSYSYYQSSYEIAKNGGNLQTISTWRNHLDTSGFPFNFKNDLVIRTLEIFNQYVANLAGSDTTINNYQNIEIKKQDNVESVDALSDGNIKISKLFYELSNKADVSVLLPTRTLTMFEIAKENFVEKDEIRNAIIAATENNSDINAELDILEDKLSKDNFEVKLVERQIEGNSVQVLVEIIDNNNKYPVYDETVDMRNIQLNFIVISGKD